MTWTATERHHRGKLFIDVVDENDHLACRLFEWATDGAAIEQMRARARLIVQAEAMHGMLEIVLDWVGNWDPNFAADDDWIEDEKTIRAIIKATQEPGDE